MQSNNIPGLPTMQDSRIQFTDSAVKGGTLSLHLILRAMEERMKGTARDEGRNEFRLWRVNLLEILRSFDFDYDQTYINIERLRHCTMEHWSNMYFNFRCFTIWGSELFFRKGLPVMGYFVAVRVLRVG